MKQWKEQILYAVWFTLYIICTALGTITERTATGHILLMILSVLFFVPGIILVYDGLKKKDKKMLFRVRLVSILSIVLTLSLIVLNILCVGAGEKVGQLLNDLLILVSTPMFCSYIRGISIFGWACIFVSSFPFMWKK
ncbi:MAG: hypothetical protein J6C41_02730 [Oscillospiraceae bacterium]|nr:hypothetical protein [Oscillospiraceae bacterium]